MIRAQVHADAAALHAAAAAHVAEAAARAVAERGRFLLVLAGGSTPRGVYHQLAAQHARRIDWERVHLFWGDERAVPAEHPESNFRMAAESLLHHVPIPPLNIHRMPGEEPAARAAALYRTQLRRFFDAPAPIDLRGVGGFDLVLLGIGTDGHTASLFPGSPALEESGWAAAAQAPAAAAVRERITLTLPALACARDVLFLATGADKRSTLEQVLAPAGSGDPLPAARVRPRNSTLWYLDAAAAPGSLP